MSQKKTSILKAIQKLPSIYRKKKRFLEITD